MNVPFPEPTTPVPARAEVFLGYLDFFRSRLVSKLEALPAGELRRSQLPSGWTPIELLKHLAYVELRWLEWGFEGRDVPDPWADSRDGRWYVAACSRSTPATSATSTSSANSPAARQESNERPGQRPAPGTCLMRCPAWPMRDAQPPLPGGRP